MIPQYSSESGTQRFLKSRKTTRYLPLRLADGKLIESAAALKRQFSTVDRDDAHSILFVLTTLWLISLPLIWHLLCDPPGITITETHACRERDHAAGE